MARILYGYRITENGIEEDSVRAGKIRSLFELYASDVSMRKASDAVGIELQVNQVKKLLRNRAYTGNDIYPAIVSPELFEKAQEVRRKRTERLGRDKPKHMEKVFPIYTQFAFAPQTEHFEDAALQAQYMYSLIRSKE